MAAVTWWNLPKSTSDSQTISAYIAAQLATHNADNSAHGQSNEAIYNHRIADILDHLDQSITNSKIIASHRTFNAVVGTDPEDDFDDIQDAIDFVNGLGGGTIFIKAGTYTQAAQITLYSNIMLEGANPNSVIIDFNSCNYGLNITGTSGTHLENVIIKNITITGVNSNPDGALAAYYVDNLLVENVTFTGEEDVTPSGNYDVWVSDCNHAIFRNNYHANSKQCYMPGNCTDLFIVYNYIESCKHRAIEFFDTGSRITIANNYAAQCGGFFYTEYGADNILVTANYAVSDTYQCIGFYDCPDTIITNNHLYGDDQDMDGIYMAQTNRVIISNNYIYNFNKSGIYFLNSDGGVDRCVITGNVCNSNDRYGVEISGADCSYNIVLGNNLSNNTAGGLSDAGTSTEAAHNVTG